MADDRVCWGTRPLGTRRADANVEMTVGVTIDEASGYEAMRHGAAVIYAGLQKAGIDTTELFRRHENVPRLSVRVLEAA